MIGDVTFEQQCGGGALCYKSAPVAGAPPIQVDCDTGETVGGGGIVSETSDSQNDVTTALWITVAILAAILLILLLFVVTRRKPEQPIVIPGKPGRATRPLLGSVGSSRRQRSMISRAN